ncbi:hypothetical protein E2562_003982 [Oryza meyeriana var. granulata]|uniref:Uncharacterized protein n=1 Tax=Oryza meyeriana var. granulata TaxID=110450 RepID=A0A6G1BIB7_9ORYZ|nr:hypothetical protein E2562_003982 [Oryza meyeriana var. granulata]
MDSSLAGLGSTDLWTAGLESDTATSAASRGFRSGGSIAGSPWLGGFVAGRPWELWQHGSDIHRLRDDGCVTGEPWQHRSIAGDVHEEKFFRHNQ